MPRASSSRELPGLQIPTGQIIVDPDLIEQYRSDSSMLAPAGHPRAAIIARSTEDVSATLSYANHHLIPVVTRGAGSGLSGGANAVEGCLVLVTAGMNQMTDFSRSDLFAVVQPGLINGTLKERASEARLMYPPDPASYEFSTLGGNIATNAGGLCCVKYGVTGDYVMDLGVVLADGRMTRIGSKSRKSVAGYDLTSLIVGSEGTLAIVVSATLRLIPLPQAPGTVVALFRTQERVGELPGRIAEEGITPSMLELMDRTTINAVENHYPMGIDRDLEAIVIAQADSPDREVVVKRIAEIAARLGAGETYQTADPTDAEMLLQSRRLAFHALEREPGVALLDDVSVPLSRVPTLIADIKKIGARFGVKIGTFGHLGDGNLHPTILFRPQDQEERRSAEAAFNAILDTSLQLGGSVTGEHGVGIIKRRHVADELASAAQDLHKQVKAVFDPNGILNPGKALPMTSAEDVSNLTGTQD